MLFIILGPLDVPSAAPPSLSPIASEERDTILYSIDVPILQSTQGPVNDNGILFARTVSSVGSVYSAQAQRTPEGSKPLIGPGPLQKSSPYDS